MFDTVVDAFGLWSATAFVPRLRAAFVVALSRYRFLEGSEGAGGSVRRSFVSDGRGEFEELELHEFRLAMEKRGGLLVGERAVAKGVNKAGIERGHTQVLPKPAPPAKAQFNRLKGYSFGEDISLSNLSLVPSAFEAAEMAH